MQGKLVKNGACRFPPSMPLKLRILEKWVNFGSHTSLLVLAPPSWAFRRALLVSAATLCLWAGEVAVSHIIHSSDAQEGKKAESSWLRSQLPKTEGAGK